MATRGGDRLDRVSERLGLTDDEERSAGLVLLAGAIAAVVASPLIWVLASAYEARGELELLVQPATLEVLLNSALLVAAVTGLSILVGVPLAFLTARTDVPASRPLSVLLAMPLVVPSYIGAFAFVSAFGPQGQVQRLLEPYGVETLPSLYGFAGTTLVLTLYTYPYVFITARASLKTLDTRLVDAARTLGQDRWAAFRRVTVPQIKPAVAAGALLVALYTLSDFGTPQIMRFDVFTRVIYVRYNSFSTELAALLSLQLVVVTIVILAVESRVRGSGVRSEHPGGGRSTIALGRWRWPATLAALAVPMLALAVPLVILGLWLATAGPGRGGVGFSVAAALNSVGVAGAAALAAGLCALPLAYLAARRDSLPAWLFERAAYVGYAVPGVVMGLALVFAGARYGGALYRQGLLLLPLLVFAYVVRFLPQAVGSARASFLGVPPRLTEAARTLGESPGRAFRRVTLPLVAPGVVGGAALVFLTTMKELPATLLLRPSGFETLVTQVWTAQRSGYYGQAAVPALALLAVSAVSLFLIVRLEGYDVE
jgi:iron(III) transport system permease protein